MMNFIHNSEGRGKQFETNCLEVQIGYRRITVRGAKLGVWQVDKITSTLCLMGGFGICDVEQLHHIIRENQSSSFFFKL
jgi:hypothetical protein